MPSRAFAIEAPSSHENWQSSVLPGTLEALDFGLWRTRMGCVKGWDARDWRLTFAAQPLWPRTAILSEGDISGRCTFGGFEDVVRGWIFDRPCG